MAPRKKWDKEAMKSAITAVRNKEMGYKAASKTFNVPRATLKDYIKKGEGKSADELVDKVIGRKPVFSPELEANLVSYCKDMEQHYYGLTLKDLRRMAFQLAIRNNIAHPFSVGQQSAGRKWLQLFFKRHPTLSVRTPQSLSLARAQGFNEESVKLFFSILKPELEKIIFNPTKVFNVDETGITVVQHKVQKIVAMKGKKSVHKLSSAERGSLVTVVLCMSASGSFVPPLMIFPRKLMKNELLDGAPPGSIGAAHESGWITSELFEKWFRHFISSVKPSKEDPIVLVLDGHYSHSRNLNVIDLARDNGVSIVCLPPHSTAKLQPLDVAFMFPFKTFYAQAVENWLSNHPGRIVGNLQIAQLFNEAYERAAVVKTAVNGFKKTGILPYNPNVFGPEDFLSSAAGPSSDLELCSAVPPSTSFALSQPSTSSTVHQSTVSPRDIREVPVINPSTSKRKGSASLVTSTPHKMQLLESQEKIKRTIVPKKLNLTPNAKVKKPLKKKAESEISSDSDDNSDVPYEESSESENNEDDAECPICQNRFSEDKCGEKWVRCIECGTWFHEMCSGAKNKKKFVCDTCLEG